MLMSEMNISVLDMLLCCNRYVVSVCSVCSVNCYWISTVQCRDKWQQTVHCPPAQESIPGTHCCCRDSDVNTISTFSAQSQHCNAQWV